MVTFPTPPTYDRLMELADVRPGMLVLEPSAGQGHRQRLPHGLKFVIG